MQYKRRLVTLALVIFDTLSDSKNTITVAGVASGNLLPLAIWLSYPTRRCYQIASHDFTLWQWLSLLFWLAFLLGGLQAGWLEDL